MAGDQGRKGRELIGGRLKVSSTPEKMLAPGVMVLAATAIGLHEAVPLCQSELGDQNDFRAWLAFPGAGCYN